MSIALFDSANESEALKLKKIKDKLLEWLKEMTEAMKGDEPKLQTNDNLNIDNDE
jgi:hypothetical protein